MNYKAPYYVILSTPVTSCHSGTNVFPNTCYQNLLILSLKRELKNTVKIIDLYILILTIFDSRWDTIQKFLTPLTTIPWRQCAVNLFAIVIVISHCRSKIFDLCHVFKGFIRYVYTACPTNPWPMRTLFSKIRKNVKQEMLQIIWFLCQVLQILPRTIRYRAVVFIL
jgi:hypothetical protein